VDTYAKRREDRETDEKTDRQEDDLIKLLSFSQNKESVIKMGTVQSI
jgi:hypothetical protein